MPFPYDAEGLEVSSAPGYEPFPEGEYMLQITNAEERTSKRGHPMVVVDFEVIEHPTFDGRTIRFHNVTFMPKGEPGAGMAINFLKCIGEPHEGQFKVDPANWIAKRIKAKVKIDSWEGKRRNAVQFVDLYPGYKDGFASLAAGVVKKQQAPASEENVPF